MRALELILRSIESKTAIFIPANDAKYSNLHLRRYGKVPTYRIHDNIIIIMTNNNPSCSYPVNFMSLN